MAWLSSFFSSGGQSFACLPATALQAIADCCEVDEAAACMSSCIAVGRCQSFQRIVGDAICDIQAARRNDAEGAYSMQPRDLPSDFRSVSIPVQTNEACGLLLVGDVYPHDLRYWWAPQTTCNRQPAFIADIINSSWRQSCRQPSRLCCEIGYRTFFPIVDWQGNNWQGYDWGNRHRSIGRLANSIIGGRRGHPGRGFPCMVFYYSPYSCASFAYVINRIGELQAERAKDSYAIADVLEGQFGDQRCIRQERRCVPGFAHAPILLVELDGPDIRNLPGSRGTRCIARRARDCVSRRLDCPLVEVDVSQKESRNCIFQALLEEYLRMDSAWGLRAEVLNDFKNDQRTRRQDHRSACAVQ